MAEIFGTRRADQLFGTDENDLIRAGRGEDIVSGGLGDDTLYGGWGNDYIEDQSGRSNISGGRGSDQIFFSDGYAYGDLGNDTINVRGGGWVYGGVGNDTLSGFGALWGGWGDDTLDAWSGWAVGGMGNDSLRGNGALWGDQAPGTPPEQLAAGNDLFLMDADADGVSATGGLGVDRFHVLLDMAIPDLAIIEDFTPGVDKLHAEGQPPDGESSFGIFRDNNLNGVMDENDGGQIWVDHAANTITIGIGEGRLLVHGTTQIAFSDWDADWLF